MKYKYLHIFNSQDFKFIPKLLEAINRNRDTFNIKEHYFVTHHKKVYDLIKQYPNVIQTQYQGAAIVNYFGKDAEWIIIHSFSNVLDALFINKVYNNKIIWRTWGHDMFRNNETEHNLKYYFKSIREKLFNNKVEQFYAVAGANYIDQYNISLKCNYKRFFRIPYTYDEGIDIYFDNLQQVQHKGIRIMIGHSGDSRNNHIGIMKKLEKYKNENITIVLVLAYTPGNYDYVEKVKNYIKEYFPEKVEIMESFLPFKEYIAFLNTIDIAIFDAKDSYALGNISLLIRLGKTLYLNEDGIIHTVLKKMNFPHFCTNEILKKDKDNQPVLVDYNPQNFTELCVVNESDYLKRWNTLLIKLKKEN